MRVDFTDPTQAHAYHSSRIESFKQRRKYALIESVAKQRGVRCIVDVGCGTGPILELAQQARWFDAFVGCEPSEHLFDFAARRLPAAKLFKGTFGELPMPALPAVVVLNDVYHHIEDKRTALLRLREYCHSHPSSAAVVFEPNCYNPVTFLHQLRDDGVRLSFNGVDRACFREAGFDVDASFICFGRDAALQSWLAMKFEGSLLSGVACSVLTLPFADRS